VKFLKDGMESGEPKKRSTQGEKIAAAAADVGPRGGRGRRNDAPKTPQGGRPEKRTGKEPQREGAAKTSHPRNNPPRDGKPGNRGPRSGKPRDPSMKDRLDYYKSKYGEDFKPAAGDKAKKPGLLDRLAGLFGLGKKKP